MTTLFRKYRPQTFGNLVGQDIILETLTNELTQGSYAQSYLFYGPRGTGKTTTARLLAKAINCKERSNGSFEPCDHCSSCQEITAGRSVDVIEIDAASQTGVDNVRENIIENAQFRATSAKHKIFIIDEVHMLSTSAFNALLKTLEEPPAHVVFILATTELHKLPATIVSRCQRFTFKKISHDVMMRRLQKICIEEQLLVDPEVLERIIGKSDGCLRDAESLLGQITTLTTDGRITTASVDLVLPPSPFAAVLSVLEALSRRDAAEALKQISTLLYEGLAVDYFLTEFIEGVRFTLYSAITKTFQTGNREVTTEQRAHIETLGNIFTVSDLTRLLDICLKRRQDGRFSPIPELPLELIIAEYCTPLVPTITAQHFSPPPAPLPPSPLNEEKRATLPATNVIKPLATPHFTPLPANSVSETPVPPSVESTKISLETLRILWKKIVERVGATSHSLTFILNTAQLISLDNGRVTITVPYDFHREKLSENKNKKLLEQAIQEVTGVSILTTCEINGTSATSRTEENATGLDALAAAFGGAIVTS